ncbi:hypothetical protein ABT298_18275 [Streptomyces sp. NPDC001034]|uniref:hypothetical protein n=1 Tax=Streptomyces sp. NPDC001034 TaxID=3154375 RepID=UPI003324B62B
MDSEVGGNLLDRQRLGGGHGLTTGTVYLADTAAPMLRGRFPNEALRRDAFGAVAGHLPVDLDGPLCGHSTVLRM